MISIRVVQISKDKGLSLVSSLLVVLMQATPSLGQPPAGSFNNHGGAISPLTGGTFVQGAIVSAQIPSSGPLASPPALPSAPLPRTPLGPLPTAPISSQIMSRPSMIPSIPSPLSPSSPLVLSQPRTQIIVPQAVSSINSSVGLSTLMSATRIDSVRTGTLPSSSSSFSSSQLPLDGLVLNAIITFIKNHRPHGGELPPIVISTSSSSTSVGSVSVSSNGITLAGSALDGATLNSIDNQVKTNAVVVSTDKTQANNQRGLFEALLDVEDASAPISKHKKGKKAEVYHIALGSCQPFTIDGELGKGTVIGSPGSTFGISNDESTVKLLSGTLLAFADRGSLTVIADKAATQVTSGSICLVNVVRPGEISVVPVFGDGVKISAVNNDKLHQFQLSATEQAVLADDRISEEEIINTTGCNDVISGAIKLGDYKMIKQPADLSRIGTNNLGSLACNWQALGVKFGVPSNLAQCIDRQSASSGGSVMKSNLTEESKDPLEPVSLQNATSMPITTIETANVRALHNSKAKVSADSLGNLELLSGEILVKALKQATIRSGSESVRVAQGSVALISKQQDVLKVRTLSSASDNQVVLSVGQHSVNVGLGHEAVLAENRDKLCSALMADSISRRRVVCQSLSDKGHLATGEFSITTLIKSTDFLSKMVHERKSEHRKQVDELLKAAAAIELVTASHGLYVTPAAPAPKKVYFRTALAQ